MRMDEIKRFIAATRFLAEFLCVHDRRVAYDAPIAKADDAIRICGDLIGMRDHDDGDSLGAVQSLEDAEYFGAVS